MNMLSRRGLCAGMLMLGEVRIRATSMARFFYSLTGAGTVLLFHFGALYETDVRVHETVYNSIQGLYGVRYSMVVSCNLATCFLYSTTLYRLLMDTHM